MSFSLAPDILFNIGFLPITNTMLWLFIITLFLMIVLFVIQRSLTLVPGKLQSITELLIEEGYLFIKSIIGSDKKTKQLFPFVFTMFILILTANLAVYIPGQSAVSLYRGEKIIPVCRAVMSDYGIVFILTIVSIIIMQIAAIATHGSFGYLKKFFNFKGPLQFFLGIMDFVGEFSKVLSLSFRLFGNIFAAEILGGVILFLAPFFIPLPFMLLGLVTAVIQAFVFSVLTVVFVSLASD